MSDETEATDFLYPFLAEGKAKSLTAVLAEVSASTRQKAAEVTAMRRAFIAEQGEALIAAARTLAGALAGGGTLLTMGNGGSATDAQDMAADFLAPDIGIPRPAICLVNDVGMVTAVGNDVGFDNVFSRQVIAYGRRGDVLVGFSTSGQSANLLAAFARARQMGLATIAIAGYDGGRLAQAGLDHCLVVRSTYVPRIQEVHATIYHTLHALTWAILRPDMALEVSEGK